MAEDIIALSFRRVAPEVLANGKMMFFSRTLFRSRSGDRAMTQEFDALYIGTQAVHLNETKLSHRSRDTLTFTNFLQREELVLCFSECQDLLVAPILSSPILPDHLMTN